MSANRSFSLLATTTFLVLASLGDLAWRLNPCLSRGTLCFNSGVSGICRLLMAVGVEAGPSSLGVILLAGTLLLPLIGVLAVVRRAYRTIVFVRSLRHRSITPLPRGVAAVAHATGLTGRLDLVDLPQPLAFAYGFVRPRVYLSTGLVKQLDRSELQAVLGHERVHLTRRDPLRALVGHGLTTMLFWLPLARALAAHVQVAGEVEADAVVARRPDGRVALARALSKILAVSAETGRGQPYAISGLTATERRIDAFLEGKDQAGFAFSASGAVTSGFLVLALICLVLL